MDVTWAERMDLFRFALGAALVAGVVCPLIGAFLLLRRTSFYGIALPQFAAAGVVFGFVVLPWWAAHVGLGGVSVDDALSDTHAVMNYHLAWAGLFTFGGLFALVWLGRLGGSEIGRVAAAFAIANAATYFLGRLSPVGKSFVDELLQGEILGVGVHEFETLCTVLGAVLLCVLLFHRELVLVGFDREFAQVLGKRVIGFETLLNVLTGVTVAAGTMILGPTILFGLIVLPPIAARPFATSMSRFLLFSSLFGLGAVVGGVVVSFEGDFPLGASVVAVAALELLPCLFVRR
jgi:zinc transport system permease protein